MIEIFVDTAGWGNLLDPSQSLHAESLAVYKKASQTGRKLVTTNYILLELVALLTSPLRISRSRIVAFVESMKISSRVEIVHIDPITDVKAWQLLRERQDKDWSLVDCSSFVVMKDRGIIDAFTTDHHFEQAGYRCLL